MVAGPSSAAAARPAGGASKAFVTRSLVRSTGSLSGSEPQTLLRPGGMGDKLLYGYDDVVTGPGGELIPTHLITEPPQPGG